MKSKIIGSKVANEFCRLKVRETCVTCCCRQKGNFSKLSLGEVKDGKKKRFYTDRADGCNLHRGAGSIRTAARAFCAEKGPNWGGVWANVTLAELGFTLVSAADGDDLDGKYFTNESYAVVFTGYDTYTVTVTAVASLRVDKPTNPAVVTLDQNGVWTP
jgi:hypothetical protein